MVELIITAAISIIVGILLGNGIGNMKENHPDYKGEDFLNWGNDKDNENDQHQIM